MLDADDIPVVAPNELLTRFIISSRYVKADKTLRHGAFIPPKTLDLSVTRHREATDAELWEVGESVAAMQATPKTLYGRGDVCTSHCLLHDLRIEPVPVDGNPNHAEVLDWPQAGEDQTAIAKDLAKSARYIEKP